MKKRFRNSLFVFLFLSNQIFSQTLYETEGFASYYSEDFHGKLTSSGEVYDMNKLTCAHPYLPFNTWLKVTNLANQKSVIVRVNDRGPFAKNRLIDLSYAAARQLGMLGPGTIYVKIEIVSPPLTQPEVNIGKVPNETPVPQLDESEVYLRFRTKPYEPEKSKSISEFGLYNSNYNELFIYHPSPDIYRVVVGIFNNMREAQLKKSEIEKHYPGCFVITYK